MRRDGTEHPIGYVSRTLTPSEKIMPKWKKRP